MIDFSKLWIMTAIGRVTLGNSGHGSKIAIITFLHFIYYCKLLFKLDHQSGFRHQIARALAAYYHILVFSHRFDLNAAL